jgi:hypothetical protein
MTYTTITIGRLTLRETFELQSNISSGTDTQTLVLSGEESYPPLTLAQVKQRREDILGLQNRLVPIRFGTKSDHDGWYKITDVNTSVRDYQSSELRAFSWGLNAQFIGPENAVDLESRLDGVQRINDFGLSGEKWHGVPASTKTYYGGTSTAVFRATSDGASATAWRSVAASTHPRWSIALANYDATRARVLIDGVERVGINVQDLTGSSWVLTNGVVSVSATPTASSTWNVAAWDGSQWDSKGWNLGLGSSTSAQPGSAGFAYATILRNDYEVCTIRLLDDHASDRQTVDLTLRRGSRFVEGYVTTTSSKTLAIWPTAGEASTATASTGYVRATSNDAQGNRYVCGSARSFTGLTTAGGLSKAASTRMDFFIGAEVGGSAAQTGDQAANLVSQYLMALSEVTVAAVR